MQTASHLDFEFDYSHNVILHNGVVINLSPHESDTLRVLLNSRGRPTSIGVLVQRAYGVREPDAAAGSIRVAIHSLRKKIKPTGMQIRSEARVGYEIDASYIPEFDRRLPDKILLALNVARDTEETEIAKLLQAALELAEAKRRQWVLRQSYGRDSINADYSPRTA